MTLQRAPTSGLGYLVGASDAVQTQETGDLTWCPRFVCLDSAGEPYSRFSPKPVRQGERPLGYMSWVLLLARCGRYSDTRLQLHTRGLIEPHRHYFLRPWRMCFDRTNGPEVGLYIRAPPSTPPA